MASYKITTFPEIGEIPISTEPVTTGFASQFTGDIYSNRGRFGGASSYWEIKEGAITAVGALSGTVFINHGKTAFNNTQTGFILGVENATAKFYIGNSTQYLNWTGSALNIAGSLTASEIHIPNEITANSFHVDADGNSWWGAATLASSAAKVLNTGAGTFSSLTITGGTVGTNVTIVSTDAGTIEIGATKDLPPDTDLAAYISFDEGLVTSSTKVYDSSKNANDMTLVGGQTNADFVSGVSGTALNFDGTNDYASKSSPSFIDNTTGAVSIWVKFDTLASSRIIFSVLVNGATDDEFYCSLDNNSALEIVLNVNNVNLLDMVTADNVINDTNWHHIVVTSDGSTIRLYLDGVEKTLTALTGSNTGQWFASATQADIFTLGVLKRAIPIAYLDGKLDECRVYSTALTVKQVQALYKNPAGGTATMNTLIMDKLVAGTITSQTITLALTEGAGDMYIAGGTVNVAAWTATNGFILGIDDSDSNKEKFFIGDATNSLDWNVTTLNTLTIKGAMTSGTITGVAITGGTIQTAASGQRIVMASSDNTLRFYDSAAQVIGIGTTESVAIKIDLNSTTSNGLRLTSAVLGTGFDYENTGNVVNRGLKINQSSTGASNNSSCIDLSHASIGELLTGTITGTGNGISLSRTSGTGTAAMFKALSSVATNAQLLLLQKTNTTGTGILAEIETSDAGIALQVTSLNTTVTNTAAFTLVKSSSGPAQDITHTANDGSNTIGLQMNVANAGAGVEYAFSFQGSEYDGTKTGVATITGVIKVLTAADGLVYVPCYSSAS